VTNRKRYMLLTYCVEKLFCYAHLSKCLRWQHCTHGQMFG